MKKEEAIKQIESISEILNSGNQILLSVPHLISIGIVLCLIPIIDFTTQSFTFGCKISGTTTLITNLAIYYMIFFVLHRIISKIYKIEKSRTKNPLIIKAFKIKYAFTAFFALGSTALGFSGNAILIYPLIYVFIGLLYNLIGQFSLRIVRVISWTYILGGILFIYLTSVIDYDYLWKFFVIYMGLSYIYMAYSISRQSKSTPKQ